jgi:hypothetical protein
MLKMILAATLSFGLWIAGPSYAYDAPKACDPRIWQALKSGNLDEATLNRLGYKVTKLDNFDEAIVKPMSSSEWDAARPRISENLRKIKGDVEFQKIPSDPILKLGPSPAPRFKIVETPNAFKAQGTRYMRVGRKQYRLDVLETIARDANGNVSHYASLNLFEVTPEGPRKILYSDLPHAAKGDFHWFHAHDTSGEVVAQIDTAGFESSALPAVFRWARRYLAGQ